jgi:hypothetical protein
MPISFKKSSDRGVFKLRYCHIPTHQALADNGRADHGALQFSLSSSADRHVIAQANQ